MAEAMRALEFSDLIGKPYAEGAAGPDAFDCFTLVAEVYRRIGLVDRFPARFQAAVLEARALSLEDLDERWAEVPRPRELGDIALMRSFSHAPDEVRHIAVYVGHGMMLHTNARRSAHILLWSQIRKWTIAVVRPA